MCLPLTSRMASLPPAHLGSVFLYAAPRPPLSLLSAAVWARGCALCVARALPPRSCRRRGGAVTGRERPRRKRRLSPMRSAPHFVADQAAISLRHAHALLAALNRRGSTATLSTLCGSPTGAAHARPPAPRLLCGRGTHQDKAPSIVGRAPGINARLAHAPTPPLRHSAPLRPAAVWEYSLLPAVPLGACHFLPP
jgi:hypothetical protein